MCVPVHYAVRAADRIPTIKRKLLSTMIINVGGSAGGVDVVPQLPLLHMTGLIPRPPAPTTTTTSRLVRGTPGELAHVGLDTLPRAQFHPFLCVFSTLRDVSYVPPVPKYALAARESTRGRKLLLAEWQRSWWFIRKVVHTVS